MIRTYVDFTGEYYDNLDKIIDLTNEMDMRYYDISDLVKSSKYLNDL